MRVFGLNAAGGQFLPPHHDGQKSANLPVPGFLSGSTSGRPVFGSNPRYTLCRTNGVASTKLIGPRVRSRKYRMPLRATLTSPLTVRPPRWKSIRIGGDTSSQSHDSFGSYCMWPLI